MAPVFKKYGISTAGLITDWPAIVGSELASFAAPERLVWSRQPRTASETGDGRRATLVLRVEAARALDVQYRARQVLDRVNAYFGYAAISELRLIQAPLPRRLEPAPKAKPGAREPLLAEVAGIADEALRRALGRLGAGVAAMARPVAART